LAGLFVVVIAWVLVTALYIAMVIAVHVRWRRMTRPPEPVVVYPPPAEPAPEPDYMRRWGRNRKRAEQCDKDQWQADFDRL
jgi:hypothetical protein